MAVCLLDIIDDDVSLNHCVSNRSLTRTVSSSNLSQHILTMIVAYLKTNQAELGISEWSPPII